MASSIISLYKIDILQIGKNFMIEDFKTFVDEYDVLYHIRNFQYVKIGMNISIKINFSQEFLATSPDKDFNYCGIINSDDERVYWFYITGKNWKSENTIELLLTLDTLNTFEWGTDYTINKKTLVLREHKDRFARYRSYAGGLKISFGRRIDLFSENLNPVLYKTKEANIINDVDSSWFLFYRNKDAIEPDKFNQVNPVDCFLLSKERATTLYTTQNGTITTDNLQNGEVLTFVSSYNSIQPIFKADGETFSPEYVNNKQYNVITITRVGSNLEITGYTYMNKGLTAFTQVPERRLWIRSKDVSQVEVVNPQEVIKAHLSTSRIDADDFWVNENPIPSNISLNFSSESVGELSGLNSIDRTDSRNIKIIELPYCPVSYDYDGENLAFSSQWEYNPTLKMMKLKNEFDSIPFENSFYMDGELNPLLPNNEMSFSEFQSGISDTDLRNDENESKIYHSDFYQPKFVYDSFSLIFQNERVNFIEYNYSRNENDGYEGNGFKVRFVMSKNIVSKFLFMFPQYTTKYGTQDYDNVVAVARNNEQALYTSQYINYLRTGYNYDLKSKERNVIGGAIGLGGSIIGTTLGVIISALTNNPVGVIGSAVMGATALATSSVSYAQSVANAEQNIQQKLESSKMQAVSVQNADDIDLLNAYSGNRAKMCFYEVSPIMKKALLDMFYYCGYATQEQKVPDINTRIWFNFLQCELDLDGNSNLSLTMIDDIKNRFREGVSIFHRRGYKWDVEQVLENYETWLF